MFTTMIELRAERQRVKAEFDAQGAEVAALRTAVEQGDAQPRKLELAENKLAGIALRLSCLNDEETRLIGRCRDPELLQDRRRLKREIATLDNELRQHRAEIDAATERLLFMEQERDEHEAKQQPKRNPKLWQETLAEIDEQKVLIDDLLAAAVPREERLAAAYADLRAIECRMAGDVPIPEPLDEPSDAPTAVFRSVNPVFAFRFSDGRDGKLRFFSTVDTAVFGAALIERCRKYVPQHLVEV